MIIIQQKWYFNLNNTDQLAIGHFQKYCNTLCFPSKIAHKHCFQFLLGLTILLVPRENDNAYAKFWRGNKVHYGILESGLLSPTQ